MSNAPVLRFDVDHESITLGQLIHLEGIVSKLIREVTAEVTGAPPNAVKWIVESIQTGSPIMYTLRAGETEQLPPEKVEPAVPALVDGIEALSHGVVRPPHFNDEALERARDLAAELGERVRAVRFYRENGGEPAAVTPSVAANVVAVLHEDEFQSLGTMEGRLEALSVHDKKYFNVYQDLSGYRVECLFSESGIPATEIGAAIGSRVAVFGILTRRESGRVVRVQVRDLTVFPPPERLPSADDVAGIVE